MNAENERLTFDKAASVYDSSPFFPICGRRLADLAEVQPGSRVLDIATGTGAVLFYLAEETGPTGHVTGIDFAAGMVATAAAKIEQRGVQNADVRQMSAEALDFATDSFDAATCGFALWFIPDMARALSEAFRVLRSGSRFAVSVWGQPAEELGRRHNQLMVEYGANVPDRSGHVLTTAEAVVALLQQAGFSIAYAADEVVSVVYADAEEWWSQRMSGLQLNALTIPADGQERFKQAALTMAREYMQADGIHQARTAAFVVGVKPAP